MEAMETPCPPYYALPTHQQTLLFSTNSYVRTYNDWFQCIEGPYCNTPHYWGYNPPGEGKNWEKAWRKLDEPYPCNTALEESSSNGLDDPSTEGSSPNGYFGNINNPAFVTTKRPTNEPTRLQDMPSLISGVVWYDSNGDGRENTAINAVTQADHTAAQKERGAGVSNMKVTMRECNTDKLLGVAYTFPLAFGSGGSGSVEVVDISYIESIQQQEKEIIGIDFANDGLGIGNTEGRLGYYSFRVLPFQIPGQFYVIFESPEGYRLTGGSGDYWEVYEAAMYDHVQPMMDAPWRETNTANRRLQTNNATETAADANTTSTQTTKFDPTQIPKGPINYSGYYAKSRCLSLTEKPSKLTNVNAGLTKDSWPLVPHQYASFVVTIQFYAPTTAGRNRNLQLNVDTLECRKYQKLKSEGVEIEDIWGCEQGPTGGASAVSAKDFKELTLSEGDMVTAGMKNFLDSRVPRAWTIKFVSLAHQELKVFVDEEGRIRRLLSSLYSLLQPENDARGLQANKMIAKLELGFRLRAEYSTDKSTTDLSEVIIDSITYGADSFLSAVKSSVPSYFKLAGGVEVRDILWTPEKEAEKEAEKEKEEENDTINDEEENDDVVNSIVEGPSESESASDDNKILGMSMIMFIGIVAGSTVFICIVIGLLFFIRYRKKKSLTDSSRGSSSSGKRKSRKKSSNGKKKSTKKNRGSYEESEFSDFEESSFDDLSSRFYSDSSRYDPELRRKELDAFKGVQGARKLETYSSEGDSYETGSRSESYYSESDGGSYKTGSKSKSYYSESDGGSYKTGSKSESYYSESDGGSYTSYETDGSRSYSYASAASGHPRGSMRSSATSGRYSHRSNNPRDSMRSSGKMSRSSMRSSGRSGRSSMRSSGRSSGQFSASDLYSEESKESSSKMSKISENFSEEDYSTSMDS